MTEFLPWPGWGAARKKRHEAAATKKRNKKPWTGLLAHGSERSGWS
jgi:hypothetical protein